MAHPMVDAPAGVRMTVEDLDYFLDGEDFMHDDEIVELMMDLNDKEASKQPQQSVDAVMLPTFKTPGSSGIQVLPVTYPVPRLVIAPFDSPVSLSKVNPKGRLNSFAAEFGLNVDYQVQKSKQQSGACTYEAQLTAGLREAKGSGGTLAEAKEEAAGNCLKELVQYVSAQYDLKYKPVVKTDPEKDIMHVLSLACSQRGLKSPKYRMEAHVVNKMKPQYRYVVTASIGDVVEYGGADKKRVAIRVAATKLFITLQDTYNKGQLPVSAKK